MAKDNRHTPRGDCELCGNKKYTWSKKCLACRLKNTMGESA